MDDERLHELDSTSAIFSALGSIWWRLLSFFVLLWAGHLLGANCFTAPEFFRDVWANGFAALNGGDATELIYAPLGWLWTVISACERPIFLLWLFTLGGAFLNVWLSEDAYFHGLAIGAIGQPLHTYFAMLAEQNRDGMEIFVGLALIAIWEAAMIAGYMWFCRQRSAGY
ncbi:MAG: hypothetical protein JWQ44_1465 [Chthoniobacter sp.]|nr:hypothetical protein [Chthoniobacter sp.]